MTDLNIGDTFALTQCKAWDQDGNTEGTISGLYMVEDRVYADRTCGQWESGYLIFPAKLAGLGEGPMYFVDDFEFLAQTNPKAYGRHLAEERETEWIAERAERELGDLFGHGDIQTDRAF